MDDEPAPLQTIPATFPSFRLVQELKSFVPNPSVMEIFRMVIVDVNKNQHNHLTNEKKQILTEIEVLNSKLNKTRALLLSDSIEPEDFRTMKFEIENKINREEAKLSSSVVAVRNVGHVLNEASNGIKRNIWGIKLLSIYTSQPEEEEWDIPYSSGSSPKGFNFRIE